MLTWKPVPTTTIQANTFTQQLRMIKRYLIPHLNYWRDVGLELLFNCSTSVVTWHCIVNHTNMKCKIIAYFTTTLFLFGKCLTFQFFVNCNCRLLELHYSEFQVCFITCTVATVQHNISTIVLMYLSELVLHRTIKCSALKCSCTTMNYTGASQ